MLEYALDDVRVAARGGIVGGWWRVAVRWTVEGEQNVVDGRGGVSVYENSVALTCPSLPLCYSRGRSSDEHVRCSYSCSYSYPFS